jgi:hypothetical protein
VQLHNAARPEVEIRGDLEQNYKVKTVTVVVIFLPEAPTHIYRPQLFCGLFTKALFQLITSSKDRNLEGKLRIRE